MLLHWVIFTFVGKHTNRYVIAVKVYKEVLCLCYLKAGTFQYTLSRNSCVRVSYDPVLCIRIYNRRYAICTWLPLLAPWQLEVEPELLGCIRSCGSDCHRRTVRNSEKLYCGFRSIESCT